MRIIQIRKRSGEYRTIYVPDPEFKRECRSMLAQLEGYVQEADRYKLLHGFVTGRSPVTNALAHRGWVYSVSFDMAEWFDSVTWRSVVRGLPAGRVYRVPEKLFPDGAARQGLPTSPALSNLAMLPVLHDILKLRVAGRFGKMFVLTAYADDISMSYDWPSIGEMLLREVPMIVARYGFKINPGKTCLQCSKAGRRMITGVAVDDALHCPRYIKRKMRSALHKMNGPDPEAVRRYHGLKEWSQLKLPSGYVPPSESSPLMNAIQSIPIAAHDIASTFGSWVRKIL